MPPIWNEPLQIFGGTWRRLVTLRDEIIQDNYLRKYLTKVIL